MAIRSDSKPGTLLPARDVLPTICAKCGSSGAVPRPLNLTYRFALLITALMVLGSFLVPLHVSPSLSSPWLFAPSLIMSGFIAALVSATGTRLFLPLCDTCEARWRQLSRWRVGLIAALPVALLVLLVSSQALPEGVRTTVFALSVGVAVLGLTAASDWLLHQQLWLVQAGQDATRVWLGGVHPAAQAAFEHALIPEAPAPAGLQFMVRDTSDWEQVLPRKPWRSFEVLLLPVGVMIWIAHLSSQRGVPQQAGWALVFFFAFAAWKAANLLRHAGWLLIGREIVSIKQGLFSIRAVIGSYEWTRREFEIERVRGLQIQPGHQAGSGTPGVGGSLVFEYDGVPQRFGVDLSAAEARQIRDTIVGRCPELAAPGLRGT